jgi:NAD(P)-dependent dehydrogenase (short-subunit alcohol dehydrogenase family)
VATIGAALAGRAIRRRDAIDFAGKVVVITGARGLALIMAREWAGEGARLALLARDRGELARAREDIAAHGAEVITLKCDVRDRRDVQNAIKAVLKQYGRIDVLVNNAGVIQAGPVEHMEIEDFEDAMNTHLWGALYAILAAVPYMRQQGGGRIVNISSIGGKVAVPHLLPYSTSKFALVGLSHGMRAELAKYNIKVTTVCPGLLRTGSHLNAFFKGRHQQEFAWFSTLDALPVSSIDARRAGRQIVEACRNGDAELIISIQAQAAALFAGVFSGLTADLMALFDRFLPKATGSRGDVPKSGWESRSSLAPSALTRLSDRAAEENNELGSHPPITEQARKK